jgi:CRISPR system Cascade subunit CasA
MSPFNLISEPWTPVRYLDGRNTIVSLETLFYDAATIADLDCPPHERVSLMRLLVCITQAELGAPKTSEDWDGFGDDLETRIRAYLKREDIHPYFNLFGDGLRFLQVKIETDSEPVPTSKLIPHLATGNNPTLQDQEGGNPSRSLSPARLATALLAFQCFYPLYGAGYKGRGPCVDSNMIHTLLLGANLRETLLSNCLDQELIGENFLLHGMGRPLWELDSQSKDFESLATSSFLGRLVPRHRNLHLLKDGTGFRLQNGGLVYPPFEEAREYTATVVVIKNERQLLSARLEKALWRDLHALTVLQRTRDEKQPQAPLNLQSHCSSSNKGDVHLWVGALITDFKAKIYDTVESSVTIPTTMFQLTGHSTYELGVDYAEKQSNQLFGAVKQYGSVLKNESPLTNEAKRHFWTGIEQKVHILLNIVRNTEIREGKNFGEGNDPWTQAVWKAAVAAYEHACPRQTPRQLQAYAAGLKVLRQKSGDRKATTKRKAAA